MQILMARVKMEGWMTGLTGSQCQKKIKEKMEEEKAKVFARNLKRMMKTVKTIVLDNHPEEEN